jgi:hypothetical protein
LLDGRHHPSYAARQHQFFGVALMKRTTLLAVFLLSATAALLAQQPPAIESWADPRLDVRDGLELWLDAQRLPEAAKAKGQAAPKAGDGVAVWWDASGHQRHVRQPAHAAQPRLVQTGGERFLRFDGFDDHLRLTGAQRELSAGTVFLVTAPHDNPGDFRGFLAANAKNRRDYESGFTIDLSAGATMQLDQVNVEGRGFGGARDLLNATGPFGRLHTLEAVFDPERKSVQLWRDGQPQGTRPFTPSPLAFEEITIGARYYTNGPGAQQVRGHLPGDLVEVLIYGRVLNSEETRRVRDYLKKKHANLEKALPATLPTVITGGFLQTPVKDPPVVQMLRPGFTVRELPVDLTNINNLRYRPDGKLVALAYNGDIHLLSDTNGDGLEDRAERFWDNQGNAQATHHSHLRFGPISREPRQCCRSGPRRPHHTLAAAAGG